MQLSYIPENAEIALRQKLNLSPNERIRISYLSGTGDVVGTFRHWREGCHDPRVPVITYSAMFYDLVEKLQASAQVITPWPSDDVANDMVEFVTLSREPRRSRLGHIYNELRYTRECVEKIEQFDPHFVVASTDFQPLGWKSLGKKRKLIVSAHNTFWPMNRGSKDFKSRIKRLILAYQSSAIDAAVCTSGECARQIAEITKSRIVGQVEFPQIVERYEEHPSELAKDLLFLGRIEESKGIFLLLDAFLSLKPTHQNLTLTFAGTGTDAGELETRIAASGASNIKYIGLLDSQGVHQQIAKSDLVVCPTTSAFNEGLALVGFEAAAHGVPTLLSSVVPASELLRDACMVFEADNGSALQRSLQILTTDKAVYSGLRRGVAHIQHSLYDRSQSWGSHLSSALLSL